MNPEDDTDLDQVLGVTFQESCLLMYKKKEDKAAERMERCQRNT